MTIAQDLLDLGFVSFGARHMVPRDDLNASAPDEQRYDFLVQDNSDGRGAYLREWRSLRPCPFPALLHAGLERIENNRRKSAVFLDSGPEVLVERFDGWRITRTDVFYHIRGVSAAGSDLHASLPYDEIAQDVAIQTLKLWAHGHPTNRR